VIGAGAAGLVAAARAAEAGAPRVLLLEKNNKTGTKILMSGGTRCNITQNCDSGQIMEAFGKSGRFLRQALAQLSPQDTVAMFHRLGVATKVEATGKVFPQSDRAVEVRDALLRDAIRCGVQIQTAAGVSSLQAGPAGFEIFTTSGMVTATRVIVTTGGKSWPACGTTGDGYGWLEQLGHTLAATRPSLVPLVGGGDWSRELSGLTLPEVSLSVWQRAGQGAGKRPKKPIVSRSGGFLFTHFGFSGPTAMDVSRQLTVPGGFEQRVLRADFLPEWTSASLTDWLAEAKRQHGGQTAATVLARLVPKRLAAAVTAFATDDPAVATQPLAELKRDVLQGLVEALKGADLAVRGSRGFEKAEVTAGGVRLAEVDPRTMQSRLVPGLYIAGEILDLDGWIGGYNFQSAFSTGHMAGRAAATN